MSKADEFVKRQLARSIDMMSRKSLESTLMEEDQEAAVWTSSYV
jgi:hypothetical protein